MNRMTACSIAGQRPIQFKFKYNENHTACKRLKRCLRTQFENLFAQGVRTFYTGGALGVDMWASEILLEMQAIPAFHDLELILVLPYEGYEQAWDERSRRRMSVLQKNSSRTEIIGSMKMPPEKCYRLRNQYLINRADVLVAVLDQEDKRQSGVKLTVNLARKKQIPIILIHPDTGDVSTG